ncbi:MAG: ATP-dependent RecD-like DNA helicase, partial [Lentisphaerae bacterium]|nr:ATP-dependent RecD-like DNA helicase [Lentisphaerota bacterium]
MTAEPDSTTISGIVERVIFRNDDTGYTVCALKTSERAQPLVVVGNCAAVWEGENLRAEGVWRQHKVHGAQFQAAHMFCVEPTSRNGIQRYLGSGMIDGIGPVLAERMVAKFGDQTLEIIEKESARLESVEGIGRKRREQIKSAWNAQKAVREIMIFLHTHGVGAAQAARIHRTYGDQAIARIRENPYRLATDIWGIGFKTADRIGASLGIPRDSIHRAGAGIIHTLQVMADEGHCYAEDTLLLDEAGQLLEISGPILPQALEAGLEAGVLIREDHRIFLPHLHQAETGVAQYLRRLQ